MARTDEENTFTVTLRLKPKVAKWVDETFGGHAVHSLEDRLAATLVLMLNRKRVEVIRTSEAPARINNETVVTVPRDRFDEASK